MTSCTFKLVVVDTAPACPRRRSNILYDIHMARPSDLSAPIVLQARSRGFRHSRYCISPSLFRPSKCTEPRTVVPRAPGKGHVPVAVYHCMYRSCLGPTGHCSLQGLHLTLLVHADAEHAVTPCTVLDALQAVHISLPNISVRHVSVDGSRNVYSPAQHTRSVLC